jgi:hypothetical protein
MLFWKHLVLLITDMAILSGQFRSLNHNYLLMLLHVALGKATTGHFRHQLVRHYLLVTDRISQVISSIILG